MINNWPATVRPIDVGSSTVRLNNVNPPSIRPATVRPVNVVSAPTRSTRCNYWSRNIFHRRTRHTIVYIPLSASLPQFGVPHWFNPAHRFNPAPRPAIPSRWRPRNESTIGPIRRTIRMINPRRPISRSPISPRTSSHWPRRSSVAHRTSGHRNTSPIAFLAHLAHHRTYRHGLWTTKTPASFRHHRRWQLVDGRPRQNSLRRACGSLIGVNPQPAFTARLNFHFPKCRNIPPHVRWNVSCILRHRLRIHNRVS